MDRNDKQSEADKCSVSQAGSKTKTQQQAKKDKLAAALRDNLRRRKAAVSPSGRAESED